MKGMFVTFWADNDKHIVMILWKLPHINRQAFCVMEKPLKKIVIRVSYLDHLYALFPGKQKSGKTNYEYFILIPYESNNVQHGLELGIMRHSRQGKLLGFYKFK